jgi:hypothetical protein
MVDCGRRYAPGDVAVVWHSNDGDGGAFVDRLLARLGVSGTQLLAVGPCPSGPSEVTRRLPKQLTAKALVRCVLGVEEAGVAVEEAGLGGGGGVVGGDLCTVPLHGFLPFYRYGSCFLSATVTQDCAARDHSVRTV